MEKENSIPITQEKIYISNELVLKTFFNDFLPLCVTSTLLAPINRLKICSQNMSMISIIESEKVYNPWKLAESIFS